MKTNRLKAKLGEGEQAFGAWCVTPSSANAEALASHDYDYLTVDCQHGLIDYDSMWPMLQAVRFSEVTPLVRVPHNSTSWTGKALDAGAEGVIVPMVNSPLEAEQAAAACRYAPDGVRSHGPVRARPLLGADPAHVNREVLCLVMIETDAAVECAEEIAATEGIDGVYVGPADLAVSLDIPIADAFEHPRHLEAVAHVQAACVSAGIIPGIHTSGGEQARRRAEQGFRMCTVGTDLLLLERIARAEIDEARRARKT